MSKMQIILVSAGVLVIAIGALVRVKRISPLAWGWYGPVQRTDGVAIKGYDPVTYHAMAPVAGDSAFTLEWQGATYRFASAENLESFKADPARYLPEFGGFCAYASSKGFTASVDPTAFRIHEGRLYLFNDAGMRDKWVAEGPEGAIEKARTHWTRRLAH
jgi:YHS domain-containing protein